MISSLRYLCCFILISGLCLHTALGTSQPAEQQNNFGPIAGCPPKHDGNFFIADRFFRCVFYWCVNGEFLERGRYFSCPSGTAVPQGHYSPFPACTVHEKRCRASQGPAPGPAPAPAPVPSPAPSPVPVPITTAAPTPSPVPPTMGGGYYVYQKYHVKGGVQLFGRYNIFDCINSCQGSCKGVDFNLKYNSCWLHLAATECGPLIMREEVVHIRMGHTCPPAAASV